MSGLLSMRRHARDETAADQDGAGSSAGGGIGSSFRRLVGRTDRSGNADGDVEMSAATRAQHLRADEQQPAPSHGREASGRSILSQISIPSLSAMRQRDRESEMMRQAQRAELDQMATPSQLERGATDHDPRALAAASVGAAPPIDGVPAADGPFRPPPPAATSRKTGKSRREREEAATLFGPNLANYFGSGNSTSGAITATGLAAPTAAAAAATGQASGSLDPNTPALGGLAPPLSARQARLGSRGRARGASLSGLSMMSLGAESTTSLGAFNPNSTDTAAASSGGMMDGSTYDLISQVPRHDAGDEIAMSEGVDIDTLRRWVERSAGTDPGPLQEGASAPVISPVCTTLQSYVNVKRNAVRLAVKPPTPESGSAVSAGNSSSLGPLGPDVAASDTNLLRSSPSLSVLPSLSPAVAVGRSVAAAALPNATHTLYFEYDCAAPCASVQIFIRASRKHGSWVNYVAPAEGMPETLPDGSPAMLAQRGPPPHVLGWPVHVARLKKGFGVGHSAALCLDLKYYAPPSDRKGRTANDANATAGAGADAELAAGDGDARTDAFAMAAQGDAAYGSAIPETPAWDLQRRLEIEREDQEEEAAAERARRGARQRNPTAATTTTDPAAVAGDSSAAPAGAAEASGVAGQAAATSTDVPVETKEQRLAREKAERETLKVAIVVEALDANARPLKEPNLQTTYLRINSLPVRKPATETAEGSTPESAPPTQPQRTWSAQVEGQEAEIGPHRFQLQELYGLSSKPPPVRPAPANEDGEGDDENGNGGGGGGGTTTALAAMMDDGSNGSECLICLSAPPTTLLLPCTHGLCLECAVQLRESVMGIRQTERRRGRTPRRKYACPVCRRGFTSMLHLSKADEKLVAQSSAALLAASGHSYPPLGS